MPEDKILHQQVTDWEQKCKSNWNSRNEKILMSDNWSADINMCARISFDSFHFLVGFSCAHPQRNCNYFGMNFIIIFWLSSMIRFISSLFNDCYSFVATMRAHHQYVHGNELKKKHKILKYKRYLSDIFIRISNSVSIKDVFSSYKKS